MAKAKRGQWIHKKLKLSHHKHTGKRLPSKHTSYGVLLVISLAIGFILVVTTRAFMANADAITLDGVLNIKGFVAPPKPNSAATIESPTNKQVFNSIPIDIQGS